MDPVHNHLLTWLLVTPLIGAGVVIALPRRWGASARWVALGFGLFALALSLWMGAGFAPDMPGVQFEELSPWFPQIGASYHVGVDGVSLPMVLLTTLLVPLALLLSPVGDRPRAYFALFLLLEVGLLGVFIALDLVLFFLFWEVGLVPMYFLLNQWGSGESRTLWRGVEVEGRFYASYKFLIYTVAGSLGLLLSIQVIGLRAGTFDLLRLQAIWPSSSMSLFGLPADLVRTLGFVAFALAFAVKMPVWPFHTWLPDAYTAAPTPVAMVLSGVFSKLGAYGFLRLVLSLFPHEAMRFAGPLAWLGLAAMVLGGLAALGQDDLKRMVAYSSVGHLGFVVLGIAAIARGAAGEAGASVVAAAGSGTVLQMFNHGVIIAALFALVGMLEQRTGTRKLSQMGGLGVVVPALGGILLFCALASLGLPGLNGFVGEFLIFLGAWQVFPAVTALGTIGLVLTAAYLLWAVQRALYGPARERWASVREVTVREAVALVPLLVLMLAIGVWPMGLVHLIQGTLIHLFG